MFWKKESPTVRLARLKAEHAQLARLMNASTEYSTRQELKLTSLAGEIAALEEQIRQDSEE